MYKKTIFVITISFFILYSCCNSTESESRDISFPDANFETLIREKLDKPEGNITEKDLLQIEDLYGHNRDIIDITGIEYCINLTALGLRWNNIVDISPIKDLNKINYIRLSYNDIIDISCLSGLTKIDELKLDNNNIEDISSLQFLNKIVNLQLNDNNIKNVKSLYENSGIATGDLIEIRNNPLDSESINVYIPRLIDRGVLVYYKTYNSEYLSEFE